MPAGHKYVGAMTAPVRVLVTLGGVAAPTQLRAPANAVIVGFVPHELVLPHESLVVPVPACAHSR